MNSIRPGTRLTAQFLEVDQFTNPTNTATYNFGSGAYDIIDMFNAMVATPTTTLPPNGAALATLTATDTVGPFAVINMNPVARGAVTEFLTFTAATGISSVDTVALGAVTTVLSRCSGCTS